MPISFRDEDEPQAAELKPGKHVCTIRSVEEHTSKAGNLSIRVSAKVDDGAWLNEYLRPTRANVIRLCTACGVAAPEGNELNEEALKGLEFRALLSIEPGKDGYPDKYRIDQWLKPSAPPATKPVNKPAPAAAVKPADAPAEDDDIPF
jgi:hypothetical protein